MDHSLAFIGGGNMARSLIGGLIARGAKPTQMTVADPVGAALDQLTQRYGVKVTSDNSMAVAQAQAVILAVKPQELRKVTQQLAPSLQHRPLLISVAAGITAADIRVWSGGLPVVRAMPNRPALEGCGMTGLYATPDVPASARALAEQVLGAVGATLWLENESQMDVVTAVSGSGPAYFFLLIEMLEQAGISLGLSAEVARRLATETAYGSGCMARAAPESPATLREQVTSKGGTTEAALRHLEAHNVRDIFAEAVAAAARRSAALAQEFGGAS